MELWDAYDENFNKIEGVTLVRGEKIPEGMFHLVADVLVRHADGEYLAMRRDLNKIPAGGMWEATAGGSAIAGESAKEAARRELLEETGIAAQNLRQVGTAINRRNNTLYAMFLCDTDATKDSVTLQEGETIAYKWLRKEALLKMPPTELGSDRMREFI